MIQIAGLVEELFRLLQSEPGPCPRLHCHRSCRRHRPCRHQRASAHSVYTLRRHIHAAACARTAPGPEYHPSQL
jgi:hypothetical protein